MSMKQIVTPQVLKAKQDLITALSQSIQGLVKEHGLTREEAQGKLSAVISDVWNEAERQIVSNVPARW